MIDALIRHKWPEEKPEEGWYLVWTKDYEHVVAFYNCDKEWRVPFYSEPLTNIKYWWNLPEVENE